MNNAIDTSDLVSALDALISVEEPVVTALANASALIYERLDQINWVGFYLQDGGKLVLGPFCGKPACTTIPIGQGVCGTASAEGKTFRVDDVDLFPGHIACDAASRSEIVVPLISREHGPIGVLDIDAPILGRFKKEDQVLLESCVRILVEKLDAILTRNGGRVFA